MIDYDLLIIGTGPSAASAYYSVTRHRPSARICLLEAGPKHGPYRGKLSYKPSDRFRLNPSTFLGPGGTSELWHHVLAPLDQIDFEDRLDVGSPGWPIRLMDLKPHYENVLGLLGLEDTSVFWNADNDEDLEPLKLASLRDEFEPKLFIQLKKRWRSIEYLRKVNAPIHYSHFVKKIELQEDTLTIISENGTGEENRPLKASKVIVCAGALGSPQILYNSNITNDVRSNIGKTLLDHPMGVAMQVKRYKKFNFEILTSKKGFKYNKKIAFRLKDVVQRSENLPNSTFYFRPSFKEGYSEATEDLKNKILTYRQHIKELKFPLGLSMELAKDWGLVAQIIQYKTGFLSTNNLFDIFCVTEQTTSDSHINFVKSSGGFHIGDCVWTVSKADKNLNMKILRKICNWVNSENKASKVTVKPEDVDWTERAVSAAHHIGTLPMSLDQTKACVDDNCAVIDANEKIFIADASVMPSAGCANVTLTSMAIADRVGTYIAKTL